VHAHPITRSFSVWLAVAAISGGCSGGREKASTPPPPTAPAYTLDRPTDGLDSARPADTKFLRGITFGPLVNAGSEAAQQAELARALDVCTEQGATDLELVVQWGQSSAGAVELSPEDATIEDERLMWLMDEANARKLRVLLTPVLVVDKSPGARPDPSSEDAERWWWSYRRFAIAYARIAGQHHAWGLTLGTELPAMARDNTALEALIRDVRKVFKGKLGYGVRSAEVDTVATWAQFDFVALAGATGPAAADKLDDRALGVELAKDVTRLRELAERTQKEVLLSEVARSVRSEPGPVQPIAALRWSRAVFSAFHDQGHLQGVYAAGLELDAPATKARRAVARHWYAGGP
jgi:hypothetical protein